MKILISNDDGIGAEGLQLLARIAKSFDNEVYVAAPSGDRSGVSHKITIKHPLQVKAVSLEGADKAISVSGTPVDALRLALMKYFSDINFDIVLTGINHGANLGHDVFYSGTTSCALEAYSMGYSSIAFSQVWGEMRKITDVSEWVRKIIKKFENFPSRFCLNVNFPPITPAEFKGVKFTLLSGFHFGDRYTNKKKSFFDEAETELTMERTEQKAEQRKESLLDKYPILLFDQQAISAGYISITPITDDILSRELLTRLLDEHADFF